ncbi:diguanylate cyclase [Rossellomorea vietnamensis]|uniref:Diguanylate cyclase n=1 Tax=Rossellomorea vietnamensis TaxID=218284 RepID=A0A5D4K7D0_9BACI|nr:diguanylate cyclase [Rossellomorea vietnamensis]TYR72759.1 diguanylate cyclase [Rossellomorea vietnamensis]
MTKMKVYQHKLIDNIRKKLSEWLSSNDEIDSSEVRRFFHSISGTAPTIDLEKIGRLASESMKIVDRRGEAGWNRKSIQDIISPLLKECYQFEYENEIDFPMMADINEKRKIVFLVENDTSFLMLVKDYLEKRGFHVFGFTDADKAISALYDVKPDCILLDIFLGDQNGLDTLSHITKTVQKQYVPVVMMAENNSDSLRMESYQKGADDFIQKPFLLEELFIRVNRQIERKGFVDHLILVDELTRLYNRKYLRNSFTQLCAKQWEEELALSIAFLDLDYFKNVNDQYGHLTGDTVLKEFSRFVQKRIKPEEVLVRYGGEEFVLLSPGISAQKGKERLEKILNEFSAFAFEAEGGQEFTCTFSSGIVEVDAYVSTSLSYWLDMADLALYRSKENGRSQVTVFDRSMSSSHKAVSVALLEDDPIMQVLLANTIKQTASDHNLPIEISKFESGEQFLESGWINQNQKGMVLLNIFMDGMSGIETMKQADFNPFTVLMLSAETKKTEMIQAIELGVADYVIKPFSIQSLENKILFYLKKLTDHS